MTVSMGGSASNPLDLKFYFTPRTITVVAGVNNTIRWVNNETLVGALHTVTSNGPSFDSGNMAPSITFTCTLVTLGTYDYYCIYHPEMVGKVIVKSP